MNVLKFLLRLLCAVLLYICFLTVCSFAVDPKKEYSHNSPFYRFLLNSASVVVLKLLRVKIHTSGMEQMPADRKFLLVCNHRSNFDPIITWCVFKRWEPAFISKAENFKIPIFGRIIRKCCFMEIDRINPRNTMKTIQHAAELLKAGEVSVAVYPEGTRSKSGELLPFHNGMFKIAQKADAQIVVLAISGTEKIAKNLKRLKSSQVYLEVVETIPTEEVRALRSSAIGVRVMEGMEKSIEKMVRNK